MESKWLRTGVGIFLACAGIVVMPALTLVASVPDHTYSVSPESVRIEATVGTDASGTFSIAPGLGDFTEVPVGYRVSLAQSFEDYCLSWSEDGMRCVGGYDFDAWAPNGLLCEYLTLDTESSSYTQSGTLELPGDPEDTIPITLSVPCVGTECTMQDSWPPPFPASLLNRELTCDVTVGERLQVSMLAPYSAYAESAGSVVHVTGVVHEATSGVGALTLPTEASYDGVRGVVSSGPYPEKGLANEDTFTFKVVYTHSGNSAPGSASVWVDNSAHSMVIDTAAADLTLRDGDYRNGEQYVYASTYSAGTHAYWYTADPDLLLSGTSSIGEAFTFTSGYPSVAFIPGIQASRLAYTEGSTEYRTWEPVAGDREKALLLDEQGNPTVPGVYTTGVLDSAYGFDIYGDFLTFLDGLVNEGIIAGWDSFPYDWRYDVRDVVQSPIALVGGASYRMTEQLEALAHASDSGTVAIVAHSNGGLVAKTLMSELTQNGKDTLVSDLVLVASPQLGTPKAIPVLLHGEDQAIPFDWWPALFSQQDARALARTFPGAHGLLPSRAYFDKVADPVVSFEGLATLNERAKFGDSIDSYDEMVRFLKGEARLRPAYDEVEKPEVLIPDLLTKTEATQAFLANWHPPAHVRVSEIVGWGMDTIKGIKYVTRTSQTCAEDASKGRVCFPSYQLDYEPVFTVEGDGTVVWGSADYDLGRSYYVDLRSFLGLGESHAELMGKDAIQSLLAQLLKKDESTELPGKVFRDKPIPQNEGKRLRMKVLSPVSLSITDQQGNRVGISTSTGLVEESIPGSYYLEFGEGQYIGVPADGQYTVALSGTGTGTFTFIVEKVVGDVATTVAKYADVPVDTALKATLRIADAMPSTLALDTNGDGRTDVTLASGSEVSFLDYLTLFDGALKDATIVKSSKTVLQVQSSAIRLLYKGGKVKLVYSLCTLLESSIKGMVQKKFITLDDGSQLLMLVAHLKELSHN